MHTVFLNHDSQSKIDVYTAVAIVTSFSWFGNGDLVNVNSYEGKSISKSQIVIEKRRMGIMTYKHHLFFNVISKQI